MSDTNKDKEVMFRKRSSKEKVHKAAAVTSGSTVVKEEKSTNNTGNQFGLN